jgi:beta-ketoacyl synthase-like protein
VKAYVSGLSLLGPGLPGWEEARPILAGERPYRESELALPPLDILSPTERRRTGLPVRLALSAALHAARSAGCDPATLGSVFGTSNGDGPVIGAILETLSGPERLISPTQFHNSVHNAAAGYWSIAAKSTRPSTCIGGQDWTFAASLLKAVAEVTAEGAPVLMCVYDAPLPPPLAAVRPTTCGFAVGMVLSPEARRTGEPLLRLRYVAAPPDRAAEPAVEALRPLHRGNPAARSLRLLETIARGDEAVVPLAFLEDARVDVSVVRP